MIEELIKEKREQVDQEETNKIMSAIHNQAKWNTLEEGNKRMMKKLGKALNKKSKIKEVLRNEIETALLLIVSAPGFIAITLILMCLSK